MNYYARIREIQLNFVMGYQDRETCISLFEVVLHEYGLLPNAEQLDRTISNDTFIALLKRACEYKNPQSSSEPEPKEAVQQALHSLANIIKRNCPVCQKPATNLFSSVAHGMNNMTVDPPRCQVCMTKWVEEWTGSRTNSNSSIPETPTLTIDSTSPTQMSPTEFDFFRQYESEMEGFK